MIKNVRLKRVLKSTVFRGITLINKIIPKKDSNILLYMGNLGIRHNLKPLMQYLVENEYNEKYLIICGLENLKYKGKEYKNVIYVNRIKSIGYYLCSKHVFYTAGQLPIKPSNNQIVIHMNHGTCDYKAMGKLTNIQNGDEFYFTYIITTGEYYRPIVAKEYECKEENVFVCNEPTTDAFYKPLKEKYNLGDYSKVLLWLPTFRKSDILGYDDSFEDDLLLIFGESEYEELNAVLKDYRMLLVVKLHTAQSLKHYSNREYSNLMIMSDEDFVNKGYDLYQLLMQVDALIGDYSSVSLQYLLLDKPMAYVIPDISDYAEKRGFVFDNPEEYMPGHKIKSKEDFYIFLDEFSKERDLYKEERKKIKNIIHKYDDGKSCERMLELSGIV